MSGKSFIEKGQPCVIIHFDKDGVVTHTEEYNLQNVRLNKFDAEMLARTLLPRIQAFYEDPKNVAAFEKWQKERKTIESKA